MRGMTIQYTGRKKKPYETVLDVGNYTMGKRYSERGIKDFMKLHQSQIKNKTLKISPEARKALGLEEKVKETK